MNRGCKYCKINKVGLLPWLFGLRHCEDCDSEMIIKRLYGVYFVDEHGESSPRGSEHIMLNDALVLEGEA